MNRPIQFEQSITYPQMVQVQKRVLKVRAGQVIMVVGAIAIASMGFFIKPTDGEPKPLWLPGLFAAVIGLLGIFAPQLAAIQGWLLNRHKQHVRIDEHGIKFRIGDDSGMLSWEQLQYVTEADDLIIFWRPGIQASAILVKPAMEEEGVLDAVRQQASLHVEMRRFIRLGWGI